MSEKERETYFYIDAKTIASHNFCGKEFFREHISKYISTIQCLSGIINSCVENYEMEDLKPCLIKLRSSIAELNISSLNRIINDLIIGADNREPKEKLTTKLKDFLLICELVLLDLYSLKKNEGIEE